MCDRTLAPQQNSNTNVTDRFEVKRPERCLCAMAQVMYIAMRFSGTPLRLCTVELTKHMTQHSVANC